jgi:phosphate transport system substrate-binding protein
VRRVRRFPLARHLTTLVAAVLVVAACTAPPGPSSGLTGTLEVSGSSTVEPISTWVAEEFEEVESRLFVNVDGPGTGDGFELFCRGDTDISDASRTIKPSEAETCEDNGIGWIELKVAVDGLAVITSDANNSVGCLSLADLYALIGPESQGVNNWRGAQRLAAELGSTTALPDQRLDLTGPGEESGTFDSFVELALHRIAAERVDAGLLDESMEDTTRPDYVSQGNDNAIIQSVSGSTTSLGWVGYAYAADAGGIRMLEIAGADGTCVAPTPATIADGAYPLARDLYIYVNTDRAVPGQGLAAFVGFYLDNMALAAERVGYVPLNEADQQATRAAWRNRPLPGGANGVTNGGASGGTTP